MNNPIASHSKGLVNPWLLAARPKTLTAAIVPVLVGTAVAYWEQCRVGAPIGMHWDRMALALLSACAIQVGTNYFNDAIDFRRGADTKERLGPPRATQLGLLTPRQMMAGAWIVFLVALVSGAALAFLSGPEIVVIGIFSLLFGYAYTGGPFPLAYRGLGDVFVLIFFGVIAVMGSVFIQLGSWPLSGLVAGLQVGFLAVVLIAINNFRDSAGDKAAGKYTLAVLLGERMTRFEITMATLIPVVLGMFWFLWGAALAAILPLLVAPLMQGLMSGVWRTAPSAACNDLLVRAAKVHALFGVLLVAGLFLSAAWR
jgi:1,4-dihydroxy-2-naphthoate octaprenyltransferase